MKGFQVDRFEDMMAETQRVIARNLTQSLYGDNPLADYLSAGAKKPSWGTKILTKYRVKIGNFIGNIADKVRGYSLDDY